jgi:tetratricopeptide (TPR) repeat protein
MFDRGNLIPLKVYTNLVQNNFSAQTKLIIYDKRLADPQTKPEYLVKAYDWRHLGDREHDKLSVVFQPVENKPGMVMIVPTESWKRGLYSVDIKGMEYYFGIGVTNDVAFWREVLAESPQLWQAHNHLGAALFVKGNHSEALEHFAAAVKLNPQNPESHNNLGLALMTQGKIDEAIQQYREALKIIDNAAIRCNLGEALMRARKLDEAGAEFRKVLQTDPKMEAARKSLELLLKQKQGEQN